MSKTPKNKKPLPLTVIRDLPTLPYREAVRWGELDKEALGGKIPVLGVPAPQLTRIRQSVAAGTPLPISFSHLMDLEGRDLAAFLESGRFDLVPLKDVFNPDLYSQTLSFRALARADVAGISGVIRLARYEPKGASMAAQCLDSPRAAPLISNWLSGKRYRKVASEWLVTYAEAAAIGLIPIAVGEPGDERAMAEEALRFLASVERSEIVREVAGRYGEEVSSAIREVLGEAKDHGETSAWTPEFTAKVKNLSPEDLADRSVPESADPKRLKLEISRLEEAMVRERRWRGADFTSVIVPHAVLGRIARKLVWATYSEVGRMATPFRVEKDGATTDVDGAALLIAPDARVGIVHPIELPSELLARWKAVFVKSKIVAPFEQLTRQVERLTAAESSDPTLERFEGRIVATTKLRALLEAGWSYGDRDEGGVVACLEREFSPKLTAGLRFHDGIRPGERGPSRQTLGYVDFGSTKPVYDTARSEGVKLSAISAVAMSEVLRDLTALCGDS